ncbi:hypothetical protein FRC04_007117 [Tulasnella sp. 424]|nr:hypothetical protein FRC04_007117 [Tulasnella sp. 424]
MRLFSDPCSDPDWKLDPDVHYIRWAAKHRWQREPYDWQLELTLATLWGRDAVVIAPTGAGKSLPIILPLLAKDHKEGNWALCLSPLNALQELQVAAFRALGVKAVAVNASSAPMYLSLDIDKDALFINLRNDRPNIKHEIARMEGTRLEPVDILRLIPKDLTSSTPLEKTMFFCNSREACHAAEIILLAALPKEQQGQVEVYHSLRDESTKRRILNEFCKQDSQIRILICTEAAGMYGVPGSLSIWIQQAGWAARNPSLLGTATLIIKKSVWESAVVEVEEDEEGLMEDASEDEGLTGGTIEELETGALDVAVEAEELRSEEVEPKKKKAPKKVEETLLAYIQSQKCRRDVCVEVFDGLSIPEQSRGQLTQTLAPLLATGTDMMEQTPAADDEYCSTEDEDSDDSEEDQEPLAAMPLTPMAAAAVKPKTKRYPRRQGEYLLSVKRGLKTWRNVVYEMGYCQGVHPKTVIMPDEALSVLAAAKKVIEVSDFVALKLRWPLWKTYGGEVIDLLASLDDAEAWRKAEEKRRKKKQRTTTTTGTPTPKAAPRPLQPLTNIAPKPATPSTIYAHPTRQWDLPSPIRDSPGSYIITDTPSRSLIHLFPSTPRLLLQSLTTLIGTFFTKTSAKLIVRLSAFVAKLIVLSACVTKQRAAIIVTAIDPAVNMLCRQPACPTPALFLQILFHTLI